MPGKKKTTTTVDISEAESRLPQLIDEAEKGHPFTIAINGKPLVKVKHMDKREIDHLPKPEDEKA